MKLVIQRVLGSKVKVENETVGEIRNGLLVLVGVGKEDVFENAETLAKRLVNMRIMSDHQGKMNKSILETSGEVLAVSQFTLYADTTGGRRPSFIKAADPGKANQIYEHFVNELSKLGAKVQTGRFGEYMEIYANLDGPVTIIVET